MYEIHTDESWSVPIAMSRCSELGTEDDQQDEGDRRGDE